MRRKTLGRIMRRFLAGVIAACMITSTSGMRLYAQESELVYEDEESENITEEFSDEETEGTEGPEDTVERGEGSVTEPEADENESGELEPSENEPGENKPDKLEADENGPEALEPEVSGASESDADTEAPCDDEPDVEFTKAPEADEPILASWTMEEFRSIYDSAMTIEDFFTIGSDNETGLLQAAVYPAANDASLNERQLKTAITGTDDPGKPNVKITKSAIWTDIELGEAQLTITEKDDRAYSNQGMDYMIILDRTRTMSLNDKGFEGESSDKIGSSHSPCLNTSHYYLYEGRKLHLYDYTHGVVEGTNTVIEVPSDAHLYEAHYNEKGKRISPDYSAGCQDRLSIARNTICGLIDQIAAHSPTENTTCRSRVSYWSFAGCYWPLQEGEIDTDPERGLFNYIPLTDNYAQVKTKVSQTGTYAGTYYQESMKRAYEQLSARTGVYKDLPSKVIFISDGKCSDDYDEINYWNTRLKSIPNCTVYTLAIGMPVNSDAAILLKNLSTEKNANTFAAFTTNLNSENSALADTLTQIENAKVEVKAVSRVVTDLLESEYWESFEVVQADGDAKISGQTLTWKIPDSAEGESRVVIRLKLKDEYRYLISDTEYPTNHDTDQTPGCKVDYVIRGGAHNNQRQTLLVTTPYLLYGTVKLSGTKHWTVPGTEAEKLVLTLNRIPDGEVEEEEDILTVSRGIITAEENWDYSFDRREDLPLVLYNNNGRKYQYSLVEETGDYHLADETIELTNGEYHWDLYNAPYKAKIRIQKKDADTGELLSGAIFGVSTYSANTAEYLPYTGTDEAAYGEDQMHLMEVETGVYESGWLYVTADNLGKFRITEEKAPHGYDKPEIEYAVEFSVNKASDGEIITCDENGEMYVFYNQKTPVPEVPVIPEVPVEPEENEEEHQTEAEEGESALSSAHHSETISDAPKTSDPAAVEAVLSIFILAMAVLMVCILRERRKK